MSDALPLAPRPDLEQYKKLAREFQPACKSGDAGAVRAWAGGLIRNSGTGVDGAGNLARVERIWRRFLESNAGLPRSTLYDAYKFVAQCHGFANWRQFVHHVEELTRTDSAVAQFELAADAIVDGDIEILKKFLAQNPGLVRARSGREHRSTLLHYVSANGIEDFRQKTPANIVAIAELLLRTGANVNAESEAYGGGSTTLGLTATSVHPEWAGVQIALMELLIEHGAKLEGPAPSSSVVDCLRNGRGEAAGFLASRGARLNLEGAAGVGRLDAVPEFFNKDGSLKTSATEEELRDGFAWACEFGHAHTVAFLLERGMAIEARLKHNGQTGLHWAAYGGHADTVTLLLERGAKVEARDESYGGTPLEWALYGWGTAGAIQKHANYYRVVAMLVGAGAVLESQWLEADEGRRRTAEKLRADQEMQAALNGHSLGT